MPDGLASAKLHANDSDEDRFRTEAIEGHLAEISLGDLAAQRAQLSGAQFDAPFLSHLVAAHEAEIAKYSRNASSDGDGLATR